ncbi:MAG: thioredoxin domain-containing protein [Candidatus Buchananbacteria bacterium]
MYSENPSFIVPPINQPGQKKKKSWYKKWWGIVIIGFFAIFLVLLIAISFYIGNVILMLRSGEIAVEQLLGEDVAVTRQRELEKLVTKDDPKTGLKTAKVVIVEFGDFQCSACQKAHAVMKEILADYGNQVLFVFRDFPLMNDHPKALAAAMAANCAYEQGGFWEMYDKIYATNQETLAETILRNYAVELGLNMPQFDNCLESGKFLKEIEQDLQQGYELGVRATPTFFINSTRKKVEGAIPFADFEKLIIKELSR